MCLRVQFEGSCQIALASMLAVHVDFVFALTLVSIGLQNYRQLAALMVWGAFSWHGLGPLNPLEGKVIASKYTAILSAHLQPMVKHLYAERSGLFQDDNTPTHKVQGLMSIKNWPSQSPDLNLIEQPGLKTRHNIVKVNPGHSN